MRFYLGTHIPSWRTHVRVPLFISHRKLIEGGRRGYKPAVTPWALDSGAFTEIALHGRYTTTPQEYATAVRRYRDEIGMLDWAAPQDHMCEPWVLAKSELCSTVPEAQRWTTENYLTLRSLAADLPIIPVLQGWERDDYLRHVEMYAAVGVDVAELPIVGVGSVCRRQSTDEIGEVFTALRGIRCHGFGVKTLGFGKYGRLLASADSMAWSLRGRNIHPCPVRGVKTCANCLHHALEWRERALSQV